MEERGSNWGWREMGVVECNICMHETVQEQNSFIKQAS